MPHVIVKLWSGKSEGQKTDWPRRSLKTLWTFSITEKSQCRCRWKK